MVNSRIKIRIALVGGGSGGHIFPLIAVAEALRVNDSSIDIRYFGDPREYEPLFTSRGIRITRVMASKWRRYFSIKNLFEPARAFIGFIQAFITLFFYMPDVVFSKGGPGALIILYVCRFYRIPIAIHESDAKPGLTNLISSKFAKIIFLAFPSAQSYFTRGKGIKKVVGLPVRAEIAVAAIGKDRAKSELGFDPMLPLLLVIGGSQGAWSLNEFILEHIDVLLPEIQILHQVGADNAVEYKKEFDAVSAHMPKELLVRYKFAPFFVSNMGVVLRAADAAISRAGASSIFELAASGVPAILIPLPSSANDHQRENAYAYAAAKGATVVEEGNLLSGIVFSNIKRMLGPEGEAMRIAAQKIFVPNSAEMIAQDILGLSNGLNG